MTSSGDAAEEVVRLAISGAEVTLRLTASAAKNVLALSMALAKNHKKLCGKTSMKKMLRETRDIRVFPMSRKQFRQFEKRAKKLRLLYASIRDKDGKEKMIDVALPATELDRANFVFEKMLYRQQEAPPGSEAGKSPHTQETEREADAKNVSRSKPGYSVTKDAPSSKESPAPEEAMTNERSAIARLRAYKQELAASTSEKVAEKVTAKVAEKSGR